MGKRTYLPELLRILLMLCVYIGHWRQKIVNNIGEDNAGLVDNVVEACEALSELLETIIPHGT